MSAYFLFQGPFAAVESRPDQLVGHLDNSMVHLVPMDLFSLVALAVRGLVVHHDPTVVHLLVARCLAARCLVVRCLGAHHLVAHFLVAHHLMANPLIAHLIAHHLAAHPLITHPLVAHPPVAYHL